MAYKTPGQRLYSRWPGSFWADAMLFTAQGGTRQPGGFSVDFVDALAYALESGQGSDQAMGWCLQRVEASLDHAAEAGLAFEPPGLDGQVLEVVDILSGASSIDQELVARLQEVVATSRDQLVQKA